MSPPPVTDTDILWTSGKLKFLLHSDQQMVYEKFHAWRSELQDTLDRGEVPLGKYPWVFVVDSSRRWGKDIFGWTVMLEVALRRPGANLTYATSQKKDILDIVLEHHKKLMESCPKHLRGEYRNSYKGFPEGVYFPNGSAIKLVGTDVNADALRGRGSDGFAISEASFCSVDLEATVDSVLLPQLMGRNHAFLLMNSTPPEAGGHPWDTEFCPDARERSAYVMRTIWDAPQYSVAVKKTFLKMDENGVVPPRQRREYLCERIREENTVVIPEFSKEIHVKDFQIPKYAHGYVTLDPAVEDLCAINLCVWDFENARLLVVDEWSKRNANTNAIVDELRRLEKKYFEGLHYWNGKTLAQNPYLRVSDIDLRLITDFRQLHGIDVTPAKKDDKEAALGALRNAFQNVQILVHPRCTATIEHLEAAVWNKARSSYARSERHGHYDHLDCLKYVWRHIHRQGNPLPPAGWLAKQTQNPDRLWVLDSHLSSPNSLVQKLNNLFPSTWSRKR